jgi:hypothetical protein
MGTDCAPFLANLFLYAYEFNWLNERLKEKNFNILNKFKKTCRYIEYKSQIYPPELVLTSDNKNNQKVNNLDLSLEIKNDRLCYNFYDKRDNFNFPIVKYARNCQKLEDFKSHSLRLVGRLLGQHFKLSGLKRVYVKFLQKYNYLLLKFEGMVMEWDIL